MIKSFRVLFALLFLLLSGTTSATPLSGVLHIYAVNGFDLCGPNGSGCGSLTGDYGASAGTLSFGPMTFFGMPVLTNSVELLSEGTHLRSDGFGGTITATVGPGQVGAYVILEWSNNIIPTLMVWDVSVSTTSQTLQIFTPVDSDGDGIPGHAWTGGTFPGATAIFEFEVPLPGPGVELALDVTGGNTHECTSPAGSTVGINANINLTGGAELDSISWTVDGSPAGFGIMISPVLGLGVHNISATALTTTGETDTGFVTVNVIDTTAPDLVAGFYDSRSGEQLSSIDRPNVQWIEVRITATDTCDDNPQSEGVGGFAVQNGDVLKIQGNKDTVTMTTSELELSATTTDASGNSRSGSATLQITD